MRVTKFNDGTAISKVIDKTAWVNSTTPAYCWYNNDSVTYSNNYGGLYNNYAVSTGKLCPIGWQMPTESDWSTLINFLGGSSVAGGKMKESGTSHWLSPNFGNNSSGFNGLPAGVVNNFGTVQAGTSTYFWTNSDYYNLQFDVTYGKTISLVNSNTNAYIYDSQALYLGSSVRCIKQ